MRKKVCFQIKGEGAWAFLTRGWLRQCFLLSRQKFLNIMVGFWSRTISLSDFKNFWFFELSGLSRTTMPRALFSILPKKIEIMVGFRSRTISLSDFKNFWFFEISGSRRTTMSLSTFIYLVKNFSKLWSNFGRRRYHCRILKIFVFFNSAARAEQQCPRALFSISSKNFRNYGRILFEGVTIVPNHFFLSRFLKKVAR